MKTRKITIEAVDIEKAKKTVGLYPQTSVCDCCPVYQAFARNGLKNFHVAGAIINAKNHETLFSLIGTSFGCISMSSRTEWNDKFIGLSIEVPESLFSESVNNN